MSLATQTNEELQARRSRSLGRLQRLETQLDEQREIVVWLVEEIDKELASRLNPTQP